MNDLRYPIGKAQIPTNISAEQRQTWINYLAKYPNLLSELVQNLNEKQLDSPYREGGWTVRQVCHHLVDSHTNSYVRYKWTLTEEQPMIKAYYEAQWAELEDSRKAPLELALTSLKALHDKWVYLLRHMTEAQWQRAFRHPESGNLVRLDENLGIYVWHSKHHYAHIEGLLERSGW